MTVCPVVPPSLMEVAYSTVLGQQRNGEIPNIPESPNGWWARTCPKCKCGVALGFIIVSKMIFLFPEVKKRVGWTC